METRSSNSHHPPMPQQPAASGPNVCRVCLLTGGAAPSSMESIFCTVAEYENQTLYGILVAICAPLGQREMLTAAAVPGGPAVPERICRSCKWRLLAAYELHQTCLRSDDKLRERMESMRKQQQVPEVQVQEGIKIKQEVTDPAEQDFNQNSTVDTAAANLSFMLADQYFPEAESTMMENTTDHLLEEMAEAEVDPSETLFEENYKLNEKGNHSCGICEQEFVYKSQCRSHIIGKHDPAKPFKCDVCHYTLTTELRLIRHKAMTHGVGVIKIDENSEEVDEAGDTIFTCQICTKTFSSLVRFKKHKSVHVAFNRPFKCDICLYRFTTRSQLTQHAKTHQEKSADDQDNQDNEWACEHCEEKLPGKRALTMHIRRFHPQELLKEENKERNEYKCIICSEAFGRESVLNTHMKMHELLAFEKEREQRQEFEQLIKKESQAGQGESSMAASSSSLDVSNVHIKKKSDVDVAFVCMICEQEFDERELLLRHQKKLHTELELNIVSGAQDANNYPKEAHLADSTSPVFDLTEDSLGGDDDSMMVVDVDPSSLLKPLYPSDMAESNQKARSGGPVPKCDICQNTFQYNYQLQHHIKNSHSESKPFECKVCRMRFGYRGTLQKHELTHSAQSIRPGEHGSMMFKCKVCEAKFLELKALTAHLRIHRPNEPALSAKVNIFQCPSCPQIFCEKIKLDEHVAKVHHKQQQQQPPQQQLGAAAAAAAASAAATHMRNKPDFRRVAERQQPMSEKERFFGSLSIVKLEQPSTERIRMETS